MKSCLFLDNERYQEPYKLCKGSFRSIKMWFCCRGFEKNKEKKPVFCWEFLFYKFAITVFSINNPCLKFLGLKTNYLVLTEKCLERVPGNKNQKLLILITCSLNLRSVKKEEMPYVQ